ncbi:hypothetical protein PoB_006159100 [Plakobranchus ocellatus]|uniref:Uncharacterized protein n=1 Tax=Plakobranchus ocellatus TaxID=259542 RepID=A0AAV4CTQ3_9GAST|nr:hypothetical protein PoB_006159100 [Plakobranchus ocellatus]
MDRETYLPRETLDKGKRGRRRWGDGLPGKRSELTVSAPSRIRFQAQLMSRANGLRRNVRLALSWGAADDTVPTICLDIRDEPISRHELLPQKAHAP